MTIDFYGEIFDKYEREHSKAYVGYFSPTGRLVDYNTSLGGSHSTLGNVVSWTFLMWIKDSKAFEDFGLSEVPMMASLDKETGIIRNASLPIEEYNIETNLYLLRNSLLEFLRTLDNNPEVIKKIRRRIDKDQIPEYIRKNKRFPLDIGESVYEIERLFGRENTRNLLFLLKDICIQYLGYDGIEQIKPNGEFLTFPGLYRYYPEDQYTFVDKPRTITTTNKNINIRFYNYLLMDWKIEQVPKYIINPATKEYELEPVEAYSITTDSDSVYAEEIESIKKLVPRKDRVKFFR